MSILVIFDDETRVAALSKQILATREINIDLFSLSSDWTIIDSLINCVNNEAERGDDIKIKLLNSAFHIDEEVKRVREKISQWSYRVSNTKSFGRNVKSWFLIGPENILSSWWFTLFSIKNNFRTDVFLKIAQAQAIEKLLEPGKYSECLLVLSDIKLKRTIIRICASYKIKIKSIPQPVLSLKEVKNKAKHMLVKTSFNKCFLEPLTLLAHYWKRSSEAKRVVGSLDSRLKNHTQITLFSEFPFLDLKASQKGIFENHLYSTLQKKLESRAVRINWVLLHTNSKIKGFERSLLLGKRLINSSEEVYFWEEFLLESDLIKIMKQWIFQVIKYYIFSIGTPKNFLTANLFHTEVETLLKPVWRENCIGFTFLEGMAYYYAFKNMFKEMKTMEYCVYLCEIRPWEGALNAAREATGSNAKTIGFQHGSFSINHFFYKFSKEEIRKDNNGITIPLPDVLAVNGDASLKNFKQCGFENVKKVEAIRHMYLSDVLCNSQKPVDNKVVLIACSYSDLETSALLSMFHKVFPKAHDFNVWIKTHPARTTLGVISAKLGINLDECGYEIKHESVELILRQVSAVFVGSSAVAIEALALGLPIIIPVLPDSMFLSPLAGHEEYFTRIYNPEELKTEINNILCKERRTNVSKNVKELIEHLWHLDKSLNNWEALLK